METRNTVISMHMQNWVYKYPIPRAHRNRIAALFGLGLVNSNYYGIVDMLLGMLTATEIFLVAHWHKITNSVIYAEEDLPLGTSTRLRPPSGL